MDAIHSLLAENPYILTEGAMGTMLFAAGLTQGYSPELWNVEQPDKVAAIHQAYLDAGAQIASLTPSAATGSACRCTIFRIG